MNNRIGKSKLLAFAFSGFLLAASASPSIAQNFSQSSTPQDAAVAHDSADSDTQAPPPGPAGERCWQQAGISKSAMESRKAIMQSARSQIQEVEQNSALTPRQQRQQIREIHRTARQQAEKLIAPEQQQALQTCLREKRGRGEPSDALPANPPATSPN